MGHLSNVGATSCLTVTTNVQVETLPASSTAVYVTLVFPGRNVLPGSCVLVTLAAPQLSVANGFVQFTIAEHGVEFTVIFAGQSWKTGPDLSSTTTSNVYVVELPDKSVAVYDTGVTPIPNSSPGACVLTTFTELQSLIVGAGKLTFFVQELPAASAMVDDPVMTGGDTSLTVTANVQLDVCPPSFENV